MSPRITLHLACCAALLPPAAMAQPAPRLPTAVVTGNALRSDTVAAPVSVLDGDALVLQRGVTLADTLRGVPGVSSTWFGPNANRPVIRGQDGDRIRMLGNGGASFDASSLSFDHAVPIDPLIAERIEVLRGPAALLYGGSATGGVVNTIDNRIPVSPINGVGGAAELRAGGAASERGGAALVEAGNGRIALHADVFGRRTRDLAVPRFTPIDGGVAEAPTDSVRNSASRTEGGAVGASLTSPTSHLGLAADSYRSTYGIVVEPDVTIRMTREHVAASGEWRELGGALRTVRAQAGSTRYRHLEVEGSGEVGTTFNNNGQEARIEAEHVALGGWRGVVGAQREGFDFSALGEEAFVPDTRTRHLALFVVEEATLPFGTLEIGARIERADVDSAGDADPSTPRFGAPVERRFSPVSLAASLRTPLGGGWGLTTALAASERAPTAFELYADGVHAATAQYERGDKSLDVERGVNLDVSARWQAGASMLRAGVFVTRFSRYIVLAPTGTGFVDGGEVFPIHEFRATRAQLWGVELEGRQRLFDGAWKVDASGLVDLTRGDDRTRGEPLPRLAPWRALLLLDASRGALGLQAELDHAGRQDRVAALDTPTDGFTRLNFAATWRFGAVDADALLFARIDNALDTLGFSASSTPTVRALSPLPGRGVKAGLRLAF